jgi:hypothetical protein
MSEPSFSFLPQQFLPVPNSDTQLYWSVWKRMFEDYLLAAGLDRVSSKRKLALLRSSLGAEGYRI